MVMAIIYRSQPDGHGNNLSQSTWWSWLLFIIVNLMVMAIIYHSQPDGHGYHFLVILILHIHLWDLWRGFVYMLC